MSAQKQETHETTLTVRELRRLIENRQPHVLPDLLVTPEIAKALLEYNIPGKTNRKISNSFVSETAASMAKGEWENTGEPIIVSDEKMLNDGQHRLMGLIEAGVSVTMDIRLGVARHAFGATNAGRKRSAGDAIGMMLEVKNANAVAAAARLILMYERGLPEHGEDRMSNNQIVGAIERWPDLPASFTNHVVKLRRTLRNRVVSALAFIASRTANEASVEEFFAVLQTGYGDAANPPHMLRELLIHGTSISNSGRIATFAQCLIAWNAWRDPSIKLKRLVWRRDVAFPVVPDLVL